LKERMRAFLHLLRGGLPAIPVAMMMATMGMIGMIGMIGMAGHAMAELLEEKPAAPDIRFLLQEAVEAFGRRDYEAGRVRFRQALEMEPDNIVALVNFGSLEYRAGNHKEAISLLRRASPFHRRPSPPG